MMTLFCENRKLLGKILYLLTTIIKSPAECVCIFSPLATSSLVYAPVLPFPYLGAKNLFDHGRTRTNNLHLSTTNCVPEGDACRRVKSYPLGHAAAIKAMSCGAYVNSRKIIITFVRTGSTEYLDRQPFFLGIDEFGPNPFEKTFRRSGVTRQKAQASINTISTLIEKPRAGHGGGVNRARCCAFAVHTCFMKGTRGPPKSALFPP